MSDNLVQDIDGNIIGCPHCGSRSIRKFGYIYRAKSKKPQWMCRACGKRTVRPTILEKVDFEKQDIDPDYIPIEELIEHRKKKYAVKNLPHLVIIKFNAAETKMENFVFANGKIWVQYI